MKHIKELFFIGLLVGFASTGLAQNIPPKASLKLEKASYAPSAEAKGSLKVQFSEGLHAYQNPPTKDYMIPVEVKSEDTAIKLLKVTYPKGILKAVAGEKEPAAIYEGEITIPVVLKLGKKAGQQTIKLIFRYQQCTDQSCFPPAQIEVNTKVKVVADTAATKAEQAPDAKKFAASSGAESFSAISDAKSTPTEQTRAQETPAKAQQSSSDSGLARFVQGGISGGNWLAVFLGGIVIGLLLCLTPCVYPVIPITVSFFSNQTSGSKLGRVGLGLMYMLGIAITYGAVGGAAAAAGGSVGTLFTKPWFLFALAAMMVGLGLSMFDLYQIGIPPFIGKHIKGRSGPVGALIMGLLVGFAAAPCAGALVSAVAIEVARIGLVPVGVLVFSAIGVGIGLPFVALGALSSGAKALPKSGGWLKVVKAVLGLVVLGIAYDYLLKGLGFRIDEAKTNLAWIIFYLGSGAYLLFLEKSEGTRFNVAIKGIAVLALGFFAGGELSAYKIAGKETGKPNWVKFTPEAFESAKASGKPILIDVSADWCVKCREIEKNVFEDPQGLKALQNVVMLKIDHSTGVDPKYIEETTKLFNVKGLPHIEVFGSGGKHIATRFEIADVDDLKKLLQQAGAAP